MAVDPPLSARERLVAWARAVAAGARLGDGSRPALRLLDIDTLHLTLCFLGSRPVSEIDALADAVRGCEQHACELAVGAPLWLPPRRPHALAVEIHDRQGQLERTQQSLAGALAAASGWRPERRRFTAHVTVARVRGGGGLRARRGAGARAAPAALAASGQPLPPTPRLTFTTAALVLYRSWLAPEGARYEAIASSAGALRP